MQLKGSKMGYKSGFIGVFGRANVGKSTLVNRLTGEKVSIVTDKPQTTRDSILGIKYEDGIELLLLDTPGFNEGGGALHFHMKRELLGALESSDLALVLITPPKISDVDKKIINSVVSRKIKVVGVINKIDVRRDKSALLPLIEEFITLGVEEVIPVSALTGDGIEDLLKMIRSRIPEGNKQFDGSIYTNRPTRFLVTELIREQLFSHLKQELPYGTAVTIDTFNTGEDVTDIAATIHVEKENHKRMVIGRGGIMLKTVGTISRREIKRLLGRPCRLELFVKISEGWTSNQRKVNEFLGTLGTDIIVNGGRSQ